MKKTVIVEADATVDIDIDDILEYINYEACSGDLDSIRDAIGEMDEDDKEDKEERLSLIDDMKNRLLSSAFKKFTLEELEQKLGMTYMD